MTYISRRTRIILSRWSEECDADYILRASRKRSDGRMKRHASCEDLRAWISNNCIQNEHLLDLMSNGEATGGQPPYRLYGRFIPVPVLFELMQNGAENSEQGMDGKNPDDLKKARRNNAMTNMMAVREGSDHSGKVESGNYDSKKDEGEKCLLQRRLFACASLLCKAVSKLEKIDGIVAQANDESENLRNEEIEEAFYKCKMLCNCSKSSQDSSFRNLTLSKCNVKRRESAKCTELLRKISGLREKLKKIQECRQEVNDQIRKSQKTVDSCTSSLQVTQLYSCREQAHIKKLQKKLEKLIAERGRLLSQMCEALNCLNSLKRSSRSSMSFRKRSSKTSEDFDGNCTCGGSENSDCSDSESSSSDDGFRKDSFSDNPKVVFQSPDDGFRKDSFSDNPKVVFQSPDFEQARNSSYRNFLSSGYTDSGAGQNAAEPVNYRRVSNPKGKQKSEFNSSSAPGFTRTEMSKNQKNFPDSEDEESQQRNSPANPKKKGKLKFVCPEQSCKRAYKDSLSDFKSSLNPEQQTVILDALENIRKSRSNISANAENTNNLRTRSYTIRKDSSTSDTFPPKSGRRGKSLERGPGLGSIADRRIKSETTMKDIEKSLRNYEVRLNRLDCIDYKIEELKQKLSDANRLRQQMAKQKAEEKKNRAEERDKSNREISKLCSENRELKKQVQQLTDSFETQCRKIQCLKGTVKKAKEVRHEAEELRKELSEYRDSFEHQRKCITKWESVVALQRTEIENLMNHIRMLTTVKESAAYSPCSQKQNIQRSRSYSPEMVKSRGMPRPKKQAMAYNRSSEEEESPCCCDELRKQEIRRGQERDNLRDYCPPQSNRRTEWCRN